MMKRITRILSLTLFLILSLVACQAPAAITSTAGTQATTTAAATVAATTATETSAVTTAAATTAGVETSYPYAFKAMDGTTVEIPAEPQRIVSLSPTYTEVVYALGKGDLLVGRTDYCDYPTEVSSVESVGSMIAPSVEKIVELEPDLILVSFMEADMIAKVEQSGAKVVQIPTGHTIEGSYENMREIGRLLNANAEAAAVVAKVDADITAIHDKVKDAEPVTAYYVAGFGKDGDYTAGSDTFMHQLLEAAGADNIAKDVTGWNYTAEKLLEKDPQYVFIGSMAKQTDTFKTTEPYANLTAVKEDRVVEINDNLISREGPRMGLGVEALAKALHPDLFK